MWNNKVAVKKLIYEVLRRMNDGQKYEKKHMNSS